MNRAISFIKRVFKGLNSFVQFGASLAACVSFLGVIYALAFPASVADKVVSIQDALERARKDMQQMSTDLSAISVSSSDTALNTGTIANAVKDKLDWDFNWGASYGNNLVLRNNTNYPAKLTISVEGLQSKFYEKETRDRLLQFEVIVPASEYRAFELSEISGKSRWDFPALQKSSIKEKQYKAANYSVTICVHTEFLTGDMQQVVERRTYTGEKNLAAYELVDGNASECRQ